jgi:DNA replication protein DnaC
MNINDKLSMQLKKLMLPVMKTEFVKQAEIARNNTLSYEEYLFELTQNEITARDNNRFNRLLKESGLPISKSLANFDLSRLPKGVQHQFKALLDGRFLERKENILLFGTPGGGKTHLVCGLAQAMIRKGFKAYFRPCTALIQELLIAKSELRLNRLLKKLTSYDLIVIDEIGYVQQEKGEMEILFTLFADCYERTSILLTSNLPFSKWEGIFKDAMMAAAAIDRLIHHSVILELNLLSYRLEKSKDGKAKKGVNETKVEGEEVF